MSFARQLSGKFRKARGAFRYRSEGGREGIEKHCCGATG
jgi:hypothetical protein